MTNMYDEIEYIFNLLERHRLKEALVQIYAIALNVPTGSCALM